MCDFWKVWKISKKWCYGVATASTQMEAACKYYHMNRNYEDPMTVVVQPHDVNDHHMAFYVYMKYGDAHAVPVEIESPSWLT